MKLIKATLMGGPNMPFLNFQFGVSVQAESLLIGNLDWEEIAPVDEMGNPLPEWEASQAREKGMVAERAVIDPATMVALLKNMPAATEDHAKAKGSAFDAVREVLLGAMLVAMNYEHLTVILVSFPLITEESKSEF